VLFYGTVLLVGGVFLIQAASRAKLRKEIAVFESRESPLEARLLALVKAAQYDEEIVTRTILKALEDPNPYVRIEAARLAGARREYRAVPYLIRNLSDNTMIRHAPSGTSLPLVKIASYTALKRITGRDLGPVESPDPLEVAETIRRWEQWWRANAERFGMKVSDVEPDYETVVLNPALPARERMKFFMQAVAKHYPGLPDVAAGVLKKESRGSPLLAAAVAVAVQLELKPVLPSVLFLLEREIGRAAEGGLSPFGAWLNEVLVQLTGKDAGPLRAGMGKEEAARVLDAWRDIVDAAVRDARKRETGREKDA